MGQENEAGSEVFFQRFSRCLVNFSVSARFVKKLISYCIFPYEMDVGIFKSGRFCIDFLIMLLLICGTKNQIK